MARLSLSLEDSKSLVDILNKNVSGTFIEEGVSAKILGLPNIGNIILKMQLYFPNIVKVVSAQTEEEKEIDLGVFKNYPLFYAKLGRGNNLKISRRLILYNDVYENDYGTRSFFQEKVAGITIMEGSIAKLRTEAFVVDSSEYVRAYQLMQKLFDISVPEIKSKEGYRASFRIENAHFAIPEDGEKFIVYNDWLPIMKPQDLYRQLKDEYQITRFDGIQKL